MYIGKRWYQQGIQQTGIKQGLGAHWITLYKLNQQTHCVLCVPVVCVLKITCFGS